MAAVTPASQSPLNVNNYLKQLKWVASGSVIAYFTDLNENLSIALNNGGLSQTLSKLSIITIIINIILFLYLLIWLPFIRNSLPDYQHWSLEPSTKIVIPALTLSIMIGWCNLFIAFVLFKSILFSFFATCSVYLIVFGTIGLIPTKRRHPSKEI